MAMIIDGRAIAERILMRIKARAEALPTPPSFLGIAVGHSTATAAYLRMKQRQAEKAGISMEVKLNEACTTEALISAIEKATEDAIIVQLPLPLGIDTDRVLASIPPNKDADMLSARTREERSLVHPVAAAVRAVLEEGKIDPRGKRATVIGQGWLVGLPVADWLKEQGALVTSITKEEGDLAVACREADIIVTGAGVAGLLTADMVRSGAAVIDVGTSELGGAVVGDASPEVADVAGLFTPVPGGVGPVTVASLLENVVVLAERAVH